MLGERWQPHRVQINAVKWLLEHAEAGLFADPGVGKTSMALAGVKLLKAKRLFKKGLLVVPKNPMYLTWPDELRKWTDFHELDLELLHGSAKDRALGRKADLYAITPDGLPWLIDVIRGKTPTGRKKVVVDDDAFKEHGFDTLIVDELTKFRGYKSDRTVILQGVAHTFRRRWGLTGDPTPKSLTDLWPQMYCLDLGKSLGRVITHFRKQFCEMDPFSFKWTIKEGQENKIYERVAPHVMRIDDSHLDIPMEVQVPIKVRLPDKARRIYDKLETELITEIERETIVAKNAAVATAKCCQVASGAIYADWKLGDDPSKDRTGRKVLTVHDEKIEALENLVDTLQGEPLMVAYWYQHELDRLRKHFSSLYGKRGIVPAIGGKTKTHELIDIGARWNSGSLPLLLVQPAAGAHGLNLQRAARHVCWYSLPGWNYEYYNQLIRRVRRQGNKAKRVFVHNIIAEDTVDEAQYRVLLHRRQGQQKLFQALQDYARSRRRK